MGKTTYAAKDAATITKNKPKPKRRTKAEAAKAARAAAKAARAERRAATIVLLRSYRAAVESETATTALLQSYRAARSTGERLAVHDKLDKLATNHGIDEIGAKLKELGADHGIDTIYRVRATYDYGSIHYVRVPEMPGPFVCRFDAEEAATRIGDHAKVKSDDVERYDTWRSTLVPPIED
jgi:hypothetical protein